MNDPTLSLAHVKLLKRTISEHHAAIIGAGKALRTELMHRGKRLEMERLARKRSGRSTRCCSRSCCFATLGWRCS